MPNRYARQTILPGVGTAGQEKLSNAKILIIGCGGLGGPVAAYLAGAGVGTISLVDGDVVSESNLHRQVFFTEVGVGKASALAAHCSSLNPGTRVRALNKMLDGGNIRALVAGHDLVLDCTDAPLIKHALSDACYHLRTPLVYAAAQAFSGYLALFPMAGDDPVHLRDLYSAPDPALPDCATTGVLGTAVGTVALLQANAALCFLLGIGQPPVNQLLTYSALDNAQMKIGIAKTYENPVPKPWAKSPPTAVREVTAYDPKAYDGVFSLLSEAKEPNLLPGAERLPQRDPRSAALERMEDGKRYLLYCNSGKISLVLAGQLAAARPGVEVVSLRRVRTEL